MLYLILITLILGTSFFLAYQAAKRLEGSNISPEVAEGVLLAIELPKENEKTPIAAEQMFASLHGLLKFTPEVQEHLSLEIASSESGIRFYVFTPKHFKNFVEGQIYAQYPDAEIRVVDDYTQNVSENSHLASAEIVLARDYIFPIKTFRDFEVDPLAAITGAVGKVSPTEKIWVQILIRPVEDVWQERGHQYVTMIRSGASPVSLDPAALAADVAKQLFSHVGNMVTHATTGPQEPLKQSQLNTPPPRLSAGQDLELKAIENKLTKMGFETKVRIIAVSESEEQARQQLSSAIASFKQFSTANLNNFVPNPEKKLPKEVLSEYRRRLFPESEDNAYILNIEELASIFHLPNISVETPTIAWTRAKKGEPPLNLPTTNCTYFAETVFRDSNVKFGIKRADRRKHMYVIGKTGVGKSTLMKNMIISDMRSGEGVAFLDPHGDAIDDLLNFVPENRLEDVVIFNPADSEYPVALNMLEVVDPRQRNLIASGLLDVFKKYFANSWGPRLEYLLMNCILTLLEVPNTSLLGIVRLLTDPDYQRFIVSQISDPVMKEFWNKEFTQMKSNQKLITEAISPIQNKVGQFLNASTIRNIVGQPKSTIRIDEIINSGKIFFVNLATGRIGESNSALLGAMVISQLQFAAMRRVDMPEEQRRDFYVYADEFQKFATDSFATILSEARKYRLNLFVAHQYIEQMPLAVKDAVFGNVGTLISFVAGPTDALYLEKEFAPTFTAQDIINLGMHEVYLKLQIDNMASAPFSAKTLPPFADVTGMREQAIMLSRAKYSKPIERVEKIIRRWTETKFRLGGPPIPPQWAIEEIKKSQIQPQPQVQQPQAEFNATLIPGNLPVGEVKDSPPVNVSSEGGIPLIAGGERRSEQGNLSGEITLPSPEEGSPKIKLISR
jgi:hypothetical protein